MPEMGVLVTGGAGYIGSVLVPRLLAEGYDIRRKLRVRVLDNFMFGQTSLLDCCHDPNLEIVRGDVRDRELMKEALKGMDYIMPLAAIVGFVACDRDPIAASTTNVDAIKLLLALRDKEQRIIFPCTNSGYGIGQVNEEGKALYCTEATPLNPISLYGQTKVEAEKLLLLNGNCISLRLATVFGVSPRMRLDLLVNNFVYRAVKDRYVVLYQPHFKRNYIHIRDVAQAFLHCLRNWDKMRDQVFNIGLSTANLSKWELCEEIRRQVPTFYFVEAEVGEDIDKRNYIIDNSKIERAGFKCEFSLRDGIGELIKVYQIIK